MQRFKYDTFLKVKNFILKIYYKKITEARYNTTNWSAEEIIALNAAADGIAKIDKQDDGLLVITAPDFVPLFRRMSKNLEMISAVKEINTTKPVTAELPKERVKPQDILIVEIIRRKFARAT